MVSITAQPYRVSLWGVIVGVLVLALASVSLVLGGLAQAQEESEYPEDRTGPVATFTATDPEDKDITWTLTEVGATEDFKITDGVLEFKSPLTSRVPAVVLAMTPTPTLSRSMPRREHRKLPRS